MGRKYPSMNITSGNLSDSLLANESNQGQTPLNFEYQQCVSSLINAIELNNIKELKKLIKKCPKLIEEYIEDGRKAIHIAASLGKDGCLEILLENNSDPNSVDVLNHFSSLHLAARNGHVKCVNILLQYKASTTIQSKSDSRTPLHYAAQNSSSACLIALLSSIHTNYHNDKASVPPASDKIIDMRDIDGHTALHLAVIDDNIGCIRALLQVVFMK
jgi:ankyrin repeat protein